MGAGEVLARCRNIRHKPANRSHCIRYADDRQGPRFCSLGVPSAYRHGARQHAQIMERTLTDSEAAHERAVKEMFAGIAGRYDLLNHVLSLNIDRSWRRKVRRQLADTLARTGTVVLDVACGTGDLSIELQRDSAAQVIGTDFCRPMLR